MAEGTEHSDGRGSFSAARRALLDLRLRGDGRAPPVGKVLAPRNLADAAVLSTGQQRLWFLHQLEPGTAAYTIHQAVRVEGVLDHAALADSLNALVRRHQILRTAYRNDSGRPVPEVLQSLYLPLARVDLSSLPGPQRDDRVAEVTAEFVERPFELSAPPLIRALLVRLAEGDHVLVVTMHHIVADEWSLDVLWREISETYAAACARRRPALPELPLQYLDYALWQARRLETLKANGQLEYWREKLAGELPPLPLPSDHPRPLRQSYRGALESRDLSAGLSVRLREMSRAEGVTPFVLLLAAFKVMLHRYTGESDIVVGTPVSNRDRTELEPLIGFFVNTLVVRTEFTGNPTFRDALHRVRDTVYQALGNREVPFEAIVDVLKPERLLSHNPLFQVMFVLQQEPAAIELGPGLRLTPFPVASRAAKFDLTLFVSDSPGRFVATIEYSTELFAAATIRRMHEHLDELLRAIVEDPARRLSALPLLPEQERGILVGEWSTTAAEAAPPVSVHELFAGWARATPDVAALEFRDLTFTYAELDARASALAGELRARGVGREVCVGLCVERSPEMIVGILGILKAGAGYVPLDPALPAARLRFLIGDTRAPVVVTQQRYVPLIRDTGTDALVVDIAEADVGSPADPEPTATPDDLAYVIYTSGSTGHPKGVQVTHGNLAHSTHARRQHYGDAPGRFLLLSSFAFDSSVAGIFWTLCSGGTLVLPPPGQEQDVRALAELITRQRISHTLCLPCVYALILEHLVPGELDSLRLVIVAGETCPPSLARMHHRGVPSATLHNEYGPTEATVWCTVYEVPADFDTLRVPIGRPIPGAEVYLLDGHRQPVPIGVAGELYVGGAGVARGYLNRADETAERFVPHPFHAAGGARLYRTGDLARWCGDGNLEFLGRSDQQIKLRGYRIEPGEIVAVLDEHPAVRESLVVDASVAGAGPQPGDAGADVDAILARLSALGPDELDRLFAEVELHSSGRTHRS